MKKFLILISILFCLTGCFKRDDMEDITIYTSVYPIEYITTELYGENSKINSIYPNGVNINNYTLNDKQIKDYSKTNMFIFNGLSSEKDYVSSMFRNNKNLMIIDSTQTMEYTYKVEELWLDPSNFLMMALNIKNGLSEYSSNHYLKEEIENNYNTLKVNVSNIDAKLKLLSENADKTTIVVDNNLFKFLEKYGFTVISLEETDTLTNKTVVDVEALIKNGNVKYIYTIDSESLNDTVKSIIEKTNVEVIQLHPISNLTEKERNNKENYLTIYNQNIELLKKELYN